MDPASAVAGLIGLAGLVLQGTVQLRMLCQDYIGAQDEIDRVLQSLQTFQDLLEETVRLVGDASIIKATTLLTRSRMDSLLQTCQKDLQTWAYRIDHAIPKDASKVKQKWKKLIVAVDKPNLAYLSSKISQYVSQIDALLGVMRGDLGVASNVSIVASIWSQGIFQFSTKKQLESLTHGVQTLQMSQDGFREGTYMRLDNIGTVVGSLEVTIHDFVQRSSTTNKHSFKKETEQRRTLLPYTRNGDFVGRKLLIEGIEHKLELPKSNHRVALYGLGGVGKSQVALEVGYRMQSLFSDVSCFWVSAVSRTTFTQSYRDIATTLQIPGTDDPNKDTLDLVKTWLQREPSKWLMIIDNVDDMKSLKGESVETMDSGATGFNLLKYLPQCPHGKLLFTTRSKIAALRLTGGGLVVQIPAMDANEAQELLRVRLDEDASPNITQDCLDLVKALEYLPLAVSHAASYIREMEINPARYLRMFNDGDKKRTKLLTHTYEDLARDEGQSNTVLTTWRISFEQIERDYAQSAALLKLMGTLHWQDIPQYLLQQDQLEDEDDFDDAMSPLIAFSLIQRSPESKTFLMHRLIHIAIKSWAETLEFEKIAEKLLVRVFPLLDINRVSVEDRQRCRQLLPHAQEILGALGKEDQRSLTSVRLKFRISLYLGVLGQYRPARELSEGLIGPLQELLDGGMSDISLSVLEDHITRMILLEGNDKLALDRAEEALYRRKLGLSPDNADLIRVKDLVAMSLMAQNKYKEAETQLLEAYDATEKARGKSDLTTISVLLSLGVAYSGQRQYRQSADAYQAALDVLLPIYGERNDCVIRCIEGLAEAQRCQFRTQEGGELIRKAVALAEDINGPDHPNTLRAIIRLGCQYVDEGNSVAAFKSFERAWKGYQQLYGDNSRLTLYVLGMMAKSHASTDEAERLLRIAVQRSFQIWGPSAEKTLLMEDNLVWIQSRSNTSGKRKEAELFCRGLYETRRKALGPNNRFTLTAACRLGGLLPLLSWDEAIALLKDTAERQVKLLGENDWDVHVTETSLIILYTARADYDASETLIRRRLKLLQQQRGVQNRLVLDLKGWLGTIICSASMFLGSPAAKKRAREGGAMIVETYEAQLQLYGEEDLLTIVGASRLAKHYSEIKEYVKSEQLYQKVYKSNRRIFGEEACVTLDTESMIAWSYVCQDRYDEALGVLGRICPLQKKLFGDDCIDLIISGMFTAMALWFSDKMQTALETLRKESIERSLRLLGPKNRLISPLRKVENSIRDIIFLTGTLNWKIDPGAQPPPYKEFEALFPFNHHPETKAMSLRRVRSWHLASGLSRLYFVTNEEGRLTAIRKIRGEVEPGSRAPGWVCTRCQSPIPVADYFYRCYSKECADGEYAVCESCHDSGLTCLEFEHLPHRVKAYRFCNYCKNDTKDRYTWQCDICAEGDYDICKPCHESGRRCLVPSHHMVKRLQACYKVFDTYGLAYCDLCNNTIEDGENFYHCNVCDGGDYDLCDACFTTGGKCKDESHELSKKTWRDT